MKGSFFVVAKQDNIVTEQGVRAFLMERLLNSPFKRASVTNLDQKTVEIRLEASRKRIQVFVCQTETDVASRFGNPTIEVTGFKENPGMEIPETMRSSQALLVGQLGKGIDVQLQILETLKQMINKMEKGFEGLSNKFDCMSDKMEKGFEEMPERLSRAIREA